MLESRDDITLQELEERVHRAIANLGREDINLFKPLGSERNITQRFARWLEVEFPGWHIDCEYDQIIDGTSGTTREKVVQSLMRRVKGGFIHLNEPEEVKVIPDIIIHKRQSTNNLLVIEAKTSNNREEIEFDYEKLRGYCESEKLRYRFRLFIRFQELQDDNQIVAEYSFFENYF